LWFASARLLVLLLHLLLPPSEPLPGFVLDVAFWEVASVLVPLPLTALEYVASGAGAAEDEEGAGVLSELEFDWPWLELELSPP
jgi:hypothetical protein